MRELFAWRALLTWLVVFGVVGPMHVYDEALRKSPPVCANAFGFLADLDFWNNSELLFFVEMLSLHKDG